MISDELLSNKQIHFLSKPGRSSPVVTVTKLNLQTQSLLNVSPSNRSPLWMNLIHSVQALFILVFVKGNFYLLLQVDASFLQKVLSLDIMCFRLISEGEKNFSSGGMGSFCLLSSYSRN